MKNSIFSTERRFKVNPVEILIFSAIALVCMNSVYRLFYDGSNLQANLMLQEGNADGHSASLTGTEGRTPASLTAPAFATLDLNCIAGSTLDTSAPKIRLTGNFCNPQNTNTAEPLALTKIQALNRANKYNATVFSDHHARKFSTDYIPLVSGMNEFNMEFSYADGQKFSQSVQITKK